MNARLVLFCRFVIGAIFILAAVTKIARPADFFSDLLSYQVAFPEIFLRIVAAYLPWLELLAGLALLFNFWPETTRPVVATLCAMFVVMLAQAVARGLDLNCGCFGAAAQGWLERPDVALARAIILLIASLYLVSVSVRSSDTTA